MKNGNLWIAAGLGLLLAGGARAGSPEAEKRLKELEKIIEDQGIHLETAKRGVRLSGVVDASYSYNFNGGGTDSGVNGTPENGGNAVTGEDSNDFNLNQARLWLQKDLPEENTWAAGFMLELVYGEDAKGLDNDPGMENVEQAYVTFRAPVGNGLDILFGKWGALVGYEAPARALNRNYTGGLVASFLEPGNHTGILFSYPLNGLVSVDVGLANGWDNSDSSFLDNNQNNGENGDHGPSDFAKMVTWAVNVAAPGGNADLKFSGAYSFEGEEAFANVSNGVEDGTGGDDFGACQENAGILALQLNGNWRPKAFHDRLDMGFNSVVLMAMDNLHRYRVSTTNLVAGAAGEAPFRDRITGNDWDSDENAATAWGVALYAKYDVVMMWSRTSSTWPGAPNTCTPTTVRWVLWTGWTSVRWISEACG